MVPKRRFNPWTLEILDMLGLEGATSGTNTVGRCKSLLDQKLMEKFGENYLVTLTDHCFRRHLAKVKDFQCTSILKQNPRKEPIFSDLSTRFYYDGTDIPRVQIPVRSKIHIRLTVFRDIHSWQGIPLDEPYFTYQQRLRQMLKDYCMDPTTAISDFIPKKDQLCLVCVPTWAMIDKYMKKDLGRAWKPKIYRRTNREEEDGWQANNWFRGVMIAPCNPQNLHCFEFWLPDVCRFVPVPRDKIIPAVYRFTTIPALGIYGCLLPYNDWSITPEERTQKWYDLLHKGTIFPCTVVGHARIDTQETTLVRMPIDIEVKFSKTVKADLSLTKNVRVVDRRAKVMQENEVVGVMFD